MSTSRRRDATQVAIASPEKAAAQSSRYLRRLERRCLTDDGLTITTHLARNKSSFVSISRRWSNSAAAQTDNLTSMTEPLAYLNGEFVPVSRAALSVFDLGVVAGASVTEMARTFQHLPFRLDEHLHRLEESLATFRIDPRLTRCEFVEICKRIINENISLIPPSGDLGLIVFVSAGQNLTYLGPTEIERAKTPSVCVHTFPLPFELWADQYQTGLHLVTTSIRSIPDNVIPTKVKHRNRLHWYLADQEAKQINPHSMAILTDEEGYLTETATGNLCVVDGTTIVTPAHHVLHGISRDVVSELASSLGLTFASTRMLPEELSLASEAFLTSTPHCLLPVTKFNNRAIGNGTPGPIFRQLITAWSDLVGLDIIQQMQQRKESR